MPLLRGAAAVPWRCQARAERDELAMADVVRAAAAVNGRAGAFLIGGGDPLRRGDLWDLLAAVAALRAQPLGLCSPGHGITGAAVERLRAAGVQRLHVPFHCARQDAHDWLVGQAGALKTAHRAIRAALDAHLPVVAETVLTRPTATHLGETVEVLARVGVGTIDVRRLTAHDAPGVEFVPLSPRLELLQASLERAAAVAIERRVRLRLRDLPLCVAPRLRPLFAAPESEVWVLPDGSVQARAAAGLGCATCPGWPQCAGAPRDYVARFGWEEFGDRAAGAARVHESVADQQAGTVSPPLTFAWRGPHRVRCEACGDGASEKSYESTRVVRARLVEAARYRPSVLRLVGADLLAHPQAALLIYDALRLFPRVEVAGEASPVVEWSELDLRRLKDLRRLDVAFYGPDAAAHDAHCGIPGAFAATLRGVERWRTETQIPIGAYAVLHDARWIGGFAEAWQRGALPGEPRFRLAAAGGALEELVDGVRALPPGPARDALIAVLPRCACERAGLVPPAGAGDAPAASPHAALERVECGRRVATQPCGSDPIGAFDPCRDGAAACAVPGCPGTAVGWHHTARSQRWSGSS